MVDIISALSQKRTKLYQKKREIELEAQQRIREIGNEISDIENALHILNDAVADYLCPDCKGTGSVRKCDAAGQMEDVTCPRCHGTGVDT